MKKILLTGLVLSTLFACNKSNEKHDYVHLTGKVANASTDKITITGRKGYKKVITIKEGGAFDDTLKVNEPGFFTIMEANKKMPIYLANGVDLVMNTDENNFNDGVTFSGPGSVSNNYVVEKIALMKSKEATPQTLFKLERAEFEKTFASTKNKMEDMLEKAKKNGLDSLLYAQEKKGIQMYSDYIQKNYDRNHLNATKLTKGKPSPKFENYENYKGGTVSLDDLKGKYVYIDVWATWCGPCKREIPHLKDLEKDFHNKNIEFVSISVDKKNNHEKWKNMVKSKELSGLQLFADNDFNSKFMREYGINSIPRFILLDPEGNIVDSNAPRPSNKKTITKLFQDLGI
ncbi:TlpA family protein disulfide reductase [Aureivirga sp. CE67]|uniref:TlpA family protein disulfide reductase n=1 Tax=Aureivirga sp. CE67 TaxID=1788983 RepID=UPI0018CA6BEB|nr:TlpA disulfide reductase family protein [Aureivirga sp. CE67]